jgi:hypothetical protein
MVSEPPQRSRQREITEAVGEALVASVPLVGGALAVAYVKSVTASYERRQQQWARDVTAALADLSERVDGLDPESLAQNDTFLDALAHASAVAVTTGQQEKLDALRNAVLNAALPGDIGADLQAMFLRHVGDLTPSHLRMLKLTPESADGSPDPLLRYRTNFQNRMEFYEQLENDLVAARLINPQVTVSGHTSLTWAGRTFLRFITDPRDDLETDAGPHP